MKSRNLIELIGNIGKPPEFRAFNNGSGALKFTLATSRRKKDGEEWVDVTHWHNVVLFNKFAENYADRLRQGDQVLIRGASETRSYDQDGRKVYITEVIARSKYEGHECDIVKAKNPVPETREQNTGSNQWGAKSGGDDIPF